jgi:hypothetical protein
MSIRNKKSLIVVAVVSLVALVVLATVGLWFGLRHSFRRRILRAAEKIERESQGAMKISIGDVDVSPFGRRGTLHDVSLEFQETPRGPLVVDFDSIDVKKWKQVKTGDEFIREQEVEFRQVSSPQLDAQIAQAPPEVRKRLAAPISFDGAYGMSYQPEKEHDLRLDASVSQASLGELSLDIAVSGLSMKKLEQLSREMKSQRADAAVAQQGQQNAMALLMELKIHKIHIVLRNDGLMDVLYALEAADKGITPDDARRKMLGRLRGECDKRAEPWMQSLCGPFVAFADEPRSIRIALEPASPVEVASLPAYAMTGGPQAVIEQLGLKLTANED